MQSLVLYISIIHELLHRLDYMLNLAMEVVASYWTNREENFFSEYNLCCKSPKSISASLRAFSIALSASIIKYYKYLGS
jgi:hypothetical protein